MPQAAPRAPRLASVSGCHATDDLGMNRVHAVNDRPSHGLGAGPRHLLVLVGRKIDRPSTDDPMERQRQS